MFFRVFIALVLLAAGFLGYLVFDALMVKRSAMKVEDGYAFTVTSADLTVVEFLDYSCPHCQQIHPVITQALQRDGNVNYVVRPIRSLTPLGFEASKLVYAAGLQGDFLDAHLFMIENFETAKNDLAGALATELSLDLERLVTDKESEEVLASIMDNTNALQDMGGRSIPAFLIGGDILYQLADPLPGPDDFIALFNQARN